MILTGVLYYLTRRPYKWSFLGSRRMMGNNQVHQSRAERGQFCQAVSGSRTASFASGKCCRMKSWLSSWYSRRLLHSYSHKYTCICIHLPAFHYFQANTGCHVCPLYLPLRGVLIKLAWQRKLYQEVQIHRACSWNGNCRRYLARQMAHLVDLVC